MKPDSMGQANVTLDTTQNFDEHYSPEAPEYSAVWHGVSQEPVQSLFPYTGALEKVDNGSSGLSSKVSTDVWQSE